MDPPVLTRRSVQNWCCTAGMCLPSPPVPTATLTLCPDPHAKCMPHSVLMVSAQQLPLLLMLSCISSARSTVISSVAILFAALLCAWPQPPVTAAVFVVSRRLPLLHNYIQLRQPGVRHCHCLRHALPTLVQSPAGHTAGWTGGSGGWARPWLLCCAAGSYIAGARRTAGSAGADKNARC
jgi:hypothetical protein